MKAQEAMLAVLPRKILSLQPLADTGHHVNGAVSALAVLKGYKVSCLKAHFKNNNKYSKQIQSIGYTHPQKPLTCDFNKEYSNS